MTYPDDLEEQLAEAQRRYDAGDYDRACKLADKVIAASDEGPRKNDQLFAEGMRIFGMASYRAGDLVMADNTLAFAYETRVNAGAGDDEVTKELLLAWSEVKILRGNTLRACELLERLREIMG